MDLDPKVIVLLALSAFAAVAVSAGAVPAGAATSSAKNAAKAEVVHFIADDLDRALAEAKKSNRPIFVESLAPW